MLGRRLITTFKLSCRSSAMFANRKTLFVSLFAAPIFEVCTSYFLGRVLDSPSPTNIALRGLLLSILLMTATFIVAAFAHDRETGVLAQVISHRPLDSQYLTGVILAAVAISTASGIINLGCLALIFPVWSAIISVVDIFPLVLLTGTAFGILCAIAVLVLQDPYAALNFLIPFLPLAVGVLVPLSEYPRTIERFLRFVPPASSLKSIESGAPVFILSDYLVALVLLSLSLLLMRRVAGHFRTKVTLLQA